jgi:hypothetical protein
VIDVYALMRALIKRSWNNLTIDIRSCLRADSNERMRASGEFAWMTLDFQDRASGRPFTTNLRADPLMMLLLRGQLRFC